MACEDGTYFKGVRVMGFDEDILLMIAREKFVEAERRAEQLRAIRQASPPCRPVRAVLGMALVRLGRRIMGEALPSGNQMSLGHPQKI